MPELLPYNERELLDKLSTGDESAFNAIYRHYSAAIFTAVMVYVKDQELGMELVQEIFIKIWSKRTLLQQVESFENYLFIVARNTVFDQLKKIAVRDKLMVREKLRIVRLSLIQNETDRYVEHKQTQEILSAAVAKLPARQREVYTLYDAGLTTDEIAGRLSLSRLTIKKHLELARYAVRDYLSRRYFHDFYTLLLLVCPIFG